MAGVGVLCPGSADGESGVTVVVVTMRVVTITPPERMRDSDALQVTVLVARERAEGGVVGGGGAGRRLVGGGGAGR